MMKRFGSKKAQAISAEYVVILMIAVAAIAVMSVYIRRTFQAKARDALHMTLADASASLGSTVAVEYEPYYTRSASNTDMYQEDRTRITSVGFFNKEVEMERDVVVQSEQLSPKL